MFSTLPNRFGISVLAMFGAAAYAASNSSDGGKATASAKAKRGPMGPAGPQGPAGLQGAAGANGKDETNGAPGVNGKSVALGNATLAECPAGGAFVQVDAGPGSAATAARGRSTSSAPNTTAFRTAVSASYHNHTPGTTADLPSQAAVSARTTTDLRVTAVSRTTPPDERVRFGGTAVYAAAEPTDTDRLVQRKGIN
jgi:hypothetical protein